MLDDRSTYMYCLSVLLPLLLLPPLANTIPVTQVPLFSFRCRLVDVDGPVPPTSTWYVGQQYYGTADAVQSNGSGWSEVGNFTAADRGKAAATYQNSYMKSFYAMTTLVAVYPLVNVSNVTCELTFTGEDEGAPTATVSGRLFFDGECKFPTSPGCSPWQSAAWLGLVLYRSEHTNHSNVVGDPVVKTMHDFNAATYWSMLSALPDVKTPPKRFPLIDYFSGGDSDLNNIEAAIVAMSRLGLHGLSVPGISEPEVVQALRNNGHDITTGGTFVLGAGGTDEHPGQACAFDKNSTCNSHIWDHKQSTNLELVNDTQIHQWASDFAAPYLKAGYQPGQVSMVAQSDEPSWTWDASVPPVSTSSRVRAMWHGYLQNQGLDPSDIGQSDWNDVVPIGRMEAGAGRGTGAVNGSAYAHRECSRNNSDGSLSLCHCCSQTTRSLLDCNRPYDAR